jgi:imidazolonepropionase-like amidohydrolase
MIRTARVNGVTTALTAPSGGRIAGVASVIDLSGKYPDEMAILKNAGIVINIPSLYRASERTGGGPGQPAPESADARRRRVAEELEKLKQFLWEAKRYTEMRTRSGSVAPPPATDTGLEAMIPVMRGERPAICPADHFRDIQGAVALGDEFSLKIVIAGGQDAWKVADLLAKKKIPVLYAAVHELPRTNEDPYDVPFTSPEILRRAGVPVAIASGGSADVRNLPYRAAMAAAYGLEREDALKSITLWPAQILGISDKVGSIETGKLANLIVARGDPLDIRTEIRHVFVEGREVPPDNRNLQMYEEFAPRTPAGRTATR